MKTIFFDIETTGLSSTTDSIIEVAAVLIDHNFKVVDTFQTFINPGRKIPYMITNLTGISDATVKNSPGEFVALNDFMAWVKKHKAEVVAGHNIKRFDVRWINEKCNKYGIKSELPTNMVDTLDYATRLYKDGVLQGYKGITAKGNVSFKLEHLVSHFGLSKQTHRAIDDVMQNIVVYKKLKELEETIDYGF